MDNTFPATVPEIPVSGMTAALDYYERCLGFRVDWGRDGGGIAGISRGRSRLFLTDTDFREYFGNRPPVVVWINLDSIAEVDALHADWLARGAVVTHPPESKSWSRLHEFVVADPDGNSIQVFYNF